MSAIYNPDTDEITTQLTEGAVGVTTTTSPPASTSEIGGVPQGEVGNTDILPGVQSQINSLDAQRKADLEHINRNYNDLNQEYDDQLDIIDNMHNTIARRKVYDPRAVSARQALGSLYDTIQLIGSAASMAGNSTPPAPQLTSAQAQQQAIADRLYAAQQQADQDYATQLRLITQRQQQARADIARQRRQAQTDADRLRLNTNKHYDNLETKIIEGERKRRQDYTLTLRKEATKIQVAQGRLAKKGVKNSDEFIPYDNAYYKIDPKYRTALSYDAYDFAQRYYIDMSDFKRENNLNSKNAAAALIISALNGTLPIPDESKAQAYQDALDIFQTYFIESTPTAAQTTSTKTDIPGFSTSTSTTGKKTIPGF